MNAPPEINSPRHARWKVVAICAFLLFAVALVFSGTVRFQFINLDDYLCVLQNPHVSHGLTWHGLRWSFTNRLVGNSVPLTWITHMLDWQLYGDNAGLHHLTNVLLHAATVVLLFLVLWRMTGRLWLSALATALFAIHPMRVESVAWVTSRKDVLSGLFFVLTLGAYTSYVRHPFSVVRYMVVVVFFVLGLMSKPMLVTLPAVLLLLDYWPLGRLPVQQSFRAAMRLVAEKIPLFLIVVACCVITIWAQFVSTFQWRPWPWRIGNVLLSYVAYLGQFFYPAGLAPLCPLRGPDLPLWQTVGAGVLLFGITSAALVWRRKCPYLFVGWLWYLGTLVPVIGLVPFGAEIAADRFTYLPQIGLCIALVWGAADLCRTWPYRRWICGFCSIAILTALIGCAWIQTSYWHDSVTLWNRTLACTSNNYLAHDAMGGALILQGRIDDALAEYHKALEIEPNYAGSHYNLGVAAASRGQLYEAIAHYEKALAANPRLIAAQNNLGNALLSCGRLKEGMKHCREALRLDPDLAEASYNLGNGLYASGALDEAIKNYRDALKSRPDYTEAHFHLGLALAARRQFDDALSHYRTALNLAVRQDQPGLADAVRVQIARAESAKRSSRP